MTLYYTDYKTVYICLCHVKKLAGKRFQTLAISNVSKLSSVKPLIQMSGIFYFLTSSHHPTYTNSIQIFTQNTRISTIIIFINIRDRPSILKTESVG